MKLCGGFTVRLILVVCVKAPEVPWTVTVAGPVVAEALAVRVSVLVVLVLAGLNVAVTPLGRPEIADRATLPVNPLIGFTVIVLVPLLPWITLKVLELAERVKFLVAVTVRLIVAVCVKPPDVPVTVTAIGPPVVAVLVAVSVNTLVVVVGFVPNDAVTPLGKPEAARVTLPEKPFVGCTVIVPVLLAP